MLISFRFVKAIELNKPPQFLSERQISPLVPIRTKKSHHCRYQINQILNRSHLIKLFLLRIWVKPTDEIPMWVLLIWQSDCKVRNFPRWVSSNRSNRSTGNTNRSLLTRTLSVCLSSQCSSLRYGSFSTDSSSRYITFWFVVSMNRI